MSATFRLADFSYISPKNIIIEFLSLNHAPSRLNESIKRVLAVHIYQIIIKSYLFPVIDFFQLRKYRSKFCIYTTSNLHSETLSLEITSKFLSEVVRTAAVSPEFLSCRNPLIVANKRNPVASGIFPNAFAPHFLCEIFAPQGGNN
ncbi:hypothetical protein HanIR_Chr10g0472581 [Helianthus annuus]|nr:hypothetical protein HanIR_Chr10g0472581 [Helianthus annuus]